MLPFRRGRPVGRFYNQGGFNLSRILGGDLVFQGGGDENVAVYGDEIVIVNFLSPGETFDEASFADMLKQRRYIQAPGVVNSSADIADGYDLAAQFVKDPRRVAAHIAAALDGDTGFLQGDAAKFRRIARDIGTTPRCGVHPAGAATQSHGLAGKHARNLFLRQAIVLINHPGHHLGVCKEVRRRHIHIRPQQKT